MNPQESSSLYERPIPIEDENIVSYATTLARTGPFNLGNSSIDTEHFYGPESFNQIIVLKEPSTEHAGEVVSKKFLWAVSPQNTCTPFIAYEISAERLGYRGDLAASTSLWPSLWLHPEEEVIRERGVLLLDYHRKTLFSQEMEIHTASLPRWQPQIIIDRRTLTREDV